MDVCQRALLISSRENKGPLNIFVWCYIWFRHERSLVLLVGVQFVAGYLASSEKEPANIDNLIF